MSINTIKYPKMFSTTTHHVDVSSKNISIGECLTLLLTTAKNEFFGDPNYGTHLYEYIYEHNTAILAEMIRSEIIDAIKTYEPRIEVTEDDIEITEDNNIVNINVRYFMKDEGTYMSYSLQMLREEKQNEY